MVSLPIAIQETIGPMANDCFLTVCVSETQHRTVQRFYETTQHGGSTNIIPRLQAAMFRMLVHSQISLIDSRFFFAPIFSLTHVTGVAKMRNKLKIRNPYTMALTLRHGGGVKRHKDKTKYTRKLKHKGKNNGFSQ